MNGVFMFKRFVMAFAICGLVSGTANADTTSPKQTIKENLGVLRESLRNNQGFHAGLTAVGAGISLFGMLIPCAAISNFFAKPWNWNSFDLQQKPCYNAARKLAFYVDAEKQLNWDCKLGAALFVAGAIFAAYNAYQAAELRKRADAIQNIDDAVEQEAPENFKVA